MATETNIKDLIKKELPALLRDDPSLRQYILDLTRQQYAEKEQTEHWFYQILAELRRDREEQREKWKEQNRKWDEQNRKWDEQSRKSDERQAAIQQEFQQVHEEIMALSKKIDRSIGALGARWGTQSEAAFRNALAGILEENFAVEVLNVNEFDDEGVVFGRPEQVELDIIIKNGLLLILELKSSMDKAAMYIFERKARFYENRHQRKADKLIVISPMIEPPAQKIADKLNIQIYSDSLDVKAL